MKRIMLLTGLILVLFYGCNIERNNSLLIQNAEMLVHSQPDSALVILQGIKSTSLLRKSDIAKYALVLSQAYDKNYLEHPGDSLIKIAAEHYLEKGTDSEKADTYYMMGRVYMELDSIKYAANLLLDALKYADDSNYRLKASAYAQLGIIFQRQHEHARAQDMHKEAIKYYELIGDEANIVRTMSLLARNYSLCDDKKTALDYYEKAQNIAVKLDDTDDLMAVAVAKATTRYSINGDYKLALEELTNIYDQYNNGEIPVSHLPVIANIYYYVGDYDNSVLFMNRYNDSIGDMGKQRGALSLLATYEAARGDYEKAFKHLEEYIKVADTVNEHEKENLMHEVEKKYEKQELQNKYDSLRRISNLQNIIYILVFLVLGLILLRIVANRKQTIREKNNNIEELESYIDNLNSQIDEVDELKERISVVLNEKDEKEKHLKEVLNNKVTQTQKILEIASMYSNNSELFLKKFQKDLWKSSKEEYFEDMHEIVNDKYNGIINYLKTTYPQLNNEDLNLCCLVCFELSNNQISLIFGHSNPNSIFTKRHKLRKKLGLWASNKSLEDFISDTVESLEHSR